MVDLAMQGASQFASDHRMTLTREKEIWGIALWVEKKHGSDGWFYIAQQMDRLLAEADLDGVALWKEVSQRFEKLTGEVPIN